jgi:hypothetical protein
MHKHADPEYQYRKRTVVYNSADDKTLRSRYMPQDTSLPRTIGLLLNFEFSKEENHYHLEELKLP